MINQIKKIIPERERDEHILMKNLRHFLWSKENIVTHTLRFLAARGEGRAMH